MTDLEQQLTDHLQRRAADVVLLYDLEAVEHGIRPVKFVDRDDRPHRRPVLGVLVGAAAALIGVVAVATLIRDDRSTTVTTPPVDTSPTASVAEVPPTAAFLGSWVSTDTDSSLQTMEIGDTGGGSAQITVRDAAASVCSGLPSTMTGTGRLDSRGDLVIASPTYTCDDGSEPLVLSPPIEEQLRNITLAHDLRSDTITDNLGIVWRREGTEVPSPPSSPDPTGATSGDMWPQSSADEVRDAQELADAGDPAAAWQVEPELSSDEWWGHLRNRGGAEIVERFLRDKLGWEEFVFNTLQGDDGDGALDGTIRGIVYLRCAPGETNRLYPSGQEGHSEAPPGAELCAPSIDDLRYETVSIDLSQLDRKGADGIWVVTRWAMTAPFTLTDPLVAEAAATARLDDFLAARSAGEGAEGYVSVNGGGPFLGLDEVPLLYATTSGAPYERYEIERVSGPWWPYGEMEFEVRMFANGGDTVVEQPIAWRDVGGARLTLVHDAKETTEDGQPVEVPYEFFDGEVTAFAARPWEVSAVFDVALTLGDQQGERVELVGDPLPLATGCEQGPIPADADALARSIESNLDLQATAPVAVSVGGVDGLQMDVVVAPGANVCDGGRVLQLRSPFDQGSRMRIYLVDLPEDSATRILAIMVVAPDARFDEVLASAAPIIESIEFHTKGS